MKASRWVLIGVLFLSFLGAEAKADHDGGIYAEKPEGDSEARCWEQGEVQMSFRGLGLFAATTYALKLNFEEKGEDQCLTIEKNLGANQKVQLCMSRVSRVTWNDETTHLLWNTMYGASIHEARTILDKAKYRLGSKAETYERAFQCAYKHLNQMEDGFFKTGDGATYTLGFKTGRIVKPVDGGDTKRGL